MVLRRASKPSEGLAGLYDGNSTKRPEFEKVFVNRYKEVRVATHGSAKDWDVLWIATFTRGDHSSLNPLSKLGETIDGFRDDSLRNVELLPEFACDLVEDEVGDQPNVPVDKFIKELCANPWASDSCNDHRGIHKDPHSVSPSFLNTSSSV